MKLSFISSKRNLQFDSCCKELNVRALIIVEENKQEEFFKPLYIPEKRLRPP